MTRLRSLVRRWLQHTAGQDLIEYVLLAAFISLVAYTGAASFGMSINGWYNAFANLVEKKSNCSAQGMSSSQGKCHGG